MPTKFWISNNNASFTAASNWSDGVAPASGDTLIFNGLGTAPCTNNLSTSLTGLKIYVDHSHTANVGVLTGATRTPLDILGGELFVGRDPTGDGTGASLVYVRSNSTNSFTATVLTTAPVGSGTGIAPLVLEGTNITVNATGGLTAIAPVAGTTATAALVNVTSGQGGTRPFVIIGEGATANTITASGGNVTSYSSNTIGSITTSNGANVLILGSGAITTMTIGANSTIQHWGAGNVTTVNNAGTFDRSGDTRNITITNLVAEAGSTFNLDNGKPNSTTRTNITLSNCGMQNITVTTPIGERL